MRTAPLWKFAESRPSNVDKKSVANEQPVRLVNYTDVYKNPSINTDMELMEATASDDHIARFRLQPGDVIITKDSETPDDIGVPAIVETAEPDMVCAYHLTILKPREGQVHPRFLYWFLESTVAKSYWLTRANGVTRCSILTGTVDALPVPDHPLPAQRSIADYLDRETGEIDAMLAKLDGLAEVMEARRTTVIHRQTQLECDAQPWPTVPTAYAFGVVGSGTTPKERSHYTNDESGIPWITTSELRENTVLHTAQCVTTAAVEELSSLKVHPAGSVAIAMYGATVGRLGVLGVEATTNQACCVFSDPRGMDMRFFYYALWGQRADIIREAVGGGQPNISQGMLRRWKIPQPPLAAQRRIADHLDEVTARIDAMLAKVAQLKTLLLERRAALITDVVTGRKEVA